MYAALDQVGHGGFDEIIPIPLSPDKAERGEPDRVLALADELGRLLGVPVRQVLSLSEPVSKRDLQSQGYTRTWIRDYYFQVLEVEPTWDRTPYGRVLVVDDVCAHGMTFDSASCGPRWRRSSRPCGGLRRTSR